MFNPLLYFQKRSNNFNIIASYPLNGNSHDVVRKNNGSDVNMTYTSGYIGLCANFNKTPSNKTIQIPHKPYLNFSNSVKDEPFSISMLVNFNTTSGIQMFLNRGSNATSEMSIEYIFNANALTFRKLNGTRSIAQESRINYVFNAGVWYLITYTDSGNGTAQFYVNNTPVSTTVNRTGGYTKMLVNEKQLQVGLSAATNFPLDAKLDSLNIFGKMLSAEEVVKINELHIKGKDLW